MVGRYAINRTLTEDQDLERQWPGWHQAQGLASRGRLTVLPLRLRGVQAGGDAIACVTSAPVYG